VGKADIKYEKAFMRLDEDLVKLVNRHTKCTCFNDFAVFLLLVYRVVLVVYTMHSI
jgi:hypothetical protein